MGTLSVKANTHNPGAGQIRRPSLRYRSTLCMPCLLKGEPAVNEMWAPLLVQTFPVFSGMGSRQSVVYSGIDAPAIVLSP